MPILENLNQGNEPDPVAATGKQGQKLRRELEEAWTNREGALDADGVFERIEAKSAELRSQGK